MRRKNYPYYEIPEIQNLRELLDKKEKNSPGKLAFTFRRRKDVIKKTYLDFSREVAQLGEYLLQNYQKAHIAIFGENSYEWLLFYFAITNSGNIVVPIDSGLSAMEAAELFQGSDCVALAYSNTYQDIVDEWLKMGMTIPFYNMKYTQDYLQRGQELIGNGSDNFETVTLQTQDIATIVFTSGTTGKGKGVVLTHENICEDIMHSCEVFCPSGSGIAFLPFHHIFGMIASIMMMYHYGYPIHINHSLKYIQKDIQEFKPKTLMLVPLFVESFYKQIMDGVKKQNKGKQLRFLVKIIPFFDKMGIDLRKKFLGEVQEKFGGNLQYIICGGAALDPFYVKMFHVFGIEIRNGYGITECASVIAVNRNLANRTGSVGQVIPGCEVRIGNDGEILVKGKNVFQEYYKDEQNTKESFTDGWYHTGDLGYLDEDGFLYINGRKKNLIILSNGENVSPEGIEQELLQGERIEEIIVRGIGNHLTAEIFSSELNEEKENMIRTFIKKWNLRQPQYRQINEIIFRKAEFEKTTSKKIKRN